MKVTRKTKTRNLLALIESVEQFEEILDKFEIVPLRCDILDMRLSEFADACNSDYQIKFFKHRRAVVAFGMFKNFKLQLEQLQKAIKSLEVPRTPEEEAAAVGVNFPTGAEAMIGDVIEWYGLKNTAEGEKMHVYEWLFKAKRIAATMKMKANYREITKSKNAGNE